MDVFHSHIPLKIPFTETYCFTTSILLTSSPQNCIKSPHNSQIHFDNYFDAPSKYLLTTTYNKLSDNYKIHQNYPKLPRTPQNHSAPRSHQHPKHPLTKPLNKKKHHSIPHLTTELVPPSPKIPTKIRPGSPNPSPKSLPTRSYPLPTFSYC